MGHGYGAQPGAKNAVGAAIMRSQNTSQHVFVHFASIIFTRTNTGAFIDSLLAFVNNRKAVDGLDPLC